MIGTIVFVLAFLVIGLSVVLVAMRSGRRPPAAGHRPSRSARRAWGGGLAAFAVIIGIAVPALVLLNNGETHASQGPGGVQLTNAQVHGRELFARNCATCHTLAAANATGRVGPNFDQYNGGNVPAALVLDAIEHGRARGMGNMPAGLLTGQDAKDVASFVSTVAGR